MLTQELIGDYQKRYDLAYHVPYALCAEQMVGLQGKAVLEVGGSLPAGFVQEGLGARAWIGIEELEHYSETESRPRAEVTRRFADATPADLDAGYGIFSGRAEDVPLALQGRFDVAISFAAFEHIDRLAAALDGIFSALRPGGKLFALFAPIWSAFDGHHLPRLQDGEGRVLDFSQSPVPPWGHLLMRPPQLFKFLLQKLDRETATEIVYFVYHSPHINRLFTEDYIEYCQASAFNVIRCEGVFPLAPPPEVQRGLEHLYPGRTQFSNNGMLIILERPGAA